MATIYIGILVNNHIHKLYGYLQSTTTNNLIAGTIMYIRCQQPFVVEDEQFIFITFQRQIYTTINQSFLVIKKVSIGLKKKKMLVDILYYVSCFSC